jgi:hypothetical protein
MKAIHVDVKERTVKEIEIDKKNSLLEMQSLVGGYIAEAWALNGNVCFVDDEGWLKTTDADKETHKKLCHRWRLPRGIGQETQLTLAGNAIIVGYDDDGNSVDTTMTVEELTGMLSFGSTGMFRE